MKRWMRWATMAALVLTGAPAYAEDLGYWAEARILTPVLVREASGRQAAPPMVVALHGRGGNASEFASVWDAFVEPRPLVVVPQGAYPVPIKGNGTTVGWSWFVLSRDRELWRRADPFAVEFVLGVIRDVKSQRPAGDVYILGFSQGVSLAYMAALQAPGEVAGVIAFAGQLPTDTVPEEVFRKAAGSLRVFIAHGDQDKAVQPRESERAKKYLEGLGFAVELRTFHGAHQLSADLLREVQRWMGERRNPG